MPHSDHTLSPSAHSFADLPPFPDNVPTAPLLRISLEKLLRHDPAEEERCWKACCELGFFYLDLRTSTSLGVASNGGFSVSDSGEKLLQDADELFDVMREFFDLDVEEKVKYDFKHKGSYFGYKGVGEGIVDGKGTRDRNEFYNISKNDILSISPPLPAPAVLTPHRPLFTHFIHGSHALTHLVTSLLSARLPLKSSIRDAGGLPSLHRLSSHSGDQIRFVKAHPRRAADPGTAALGEHTDFGSVTVLFNRLGGLQVRLPSSISAVPPSEEEVPASEAEMALCADGWAYVRPLEGCCVVNLGDALVKFSKGEVRSNLHRVVDPPGAQSGVERFSLVYFARPEDEVRLRGLVEGEGEDNGNEEEGVTAKEWILRRALGRRDKDGWERSQGTEDGR